MMLPTKRFDTLMAYARGEMKDTPLFAPPGGTNYMSVHSLAEAIHGALRNAEAGKAYLVGDEMLVDAVGNPARVETWIGNIPCCPISLSCLVGARFSPTSRISLKPPCSATVAAMCAPRSPKAFRW